MRTTRTLATTTLTALALAGCSSSPLPGSPGADQQPTTPVTGPGATGSPSADTSAMGELAYIDAPFRQDDEQTARLVVRTLPDGEERVVAEGATAGTAWSPDGRRVAYIARASNGGPGAEELVVADLSIGRTTVLAMGNFHAPAWSPDGSTIAVSVSQDAGGFAIATVDANGGSLQTVTDPATGSDDLDVAWSPAGRHLAFTRAAHTEPETVAARRILLVPASGGEATDLTPGMFGEGAPAWHPDGTAIAVVARREGGRPTGGRAVLVARDGSGVTRELIGSEVWGPLAFSPDGRRIAVVTGPRQDETDISVVTLADAATVTTLDGDAFDTDPVWTAGGDRVVFLAAGGFEGRSDLLLGDPATGTIRALTEDGSVEEPDVASR